MDSSRSGIFITFEGSEGCGKSTQIALLAENLRRKYAHYEIVLLREPGGTALGERIRQVLQHADPGVSIVPEAELLLFAASRTQLVREIIQPALKRGAIILCDRFFDSTTAYQGAARALDREQVKMINHFSIGGIIPHITFLLDMETAEGRERMKRRNATSTVVDRMEQQSEDFYEAVRRGYLDLAAKEPERIVVIDASGDIEEVSQKIMTRLHQYFPLTPQPLNPSTF